MKVVVTGGAGFIGSNLARRWVREHPDDQVVVFDALTYAGRRQSVADLDSHPRFGFTHGDILDASALDGALDGADLVIHLAAESHNDRAIQDPLLFVRTNVLGTATLLEAARRNDVGRFHHVSTDEVYGSLPLDRPELRFSSGSPYAPRGPYSASKAGSDHLVRAWSETYGVRYTLTNCGNNYGPYQFPEKLIPSSILRLLRGERIQLYGDGRNVRDWIHVDDHCAAIDLVAHRGRDGSTYLVSSEEERSNRQVAESLLAIFGRPATDVEFVADRPGHDRRYSLDPSPLKSDLGWKAQHPFESGLRETTDWYRRNETWWAPLSTRGV